MLENILSTLVPAFLNYLLALLSKIFSKSTYQTQEYTLIIFARTSSHFHAHPVIFREKIEPALSDSLARIGGGGRYIPSTLNYSWCPDTAQTYQISPVYPILPLNTPIRLTAAYHKTKIKNNHPTHIIIPIQITELPARPGKSTA